MEFIIIKQDSPEYKFMWNWLSVHPLNNKLDEPPVAYHNNEAWQYMGSFRQDKKVLHTFRHRHHPLTSDRVNLTVNASENFNDADIEEIKEVR